MLSRCSSYSVIVLTLVYTYQTNSQKTAPQLFRKDYTYLEGFDAFYKEHTVQRQWTMAVATCLAEGAWLVAPKSKSELEAIQNFIGKSTTSIWLGIHDKFSESDFLTIEGKSITSEFSQWGLHQPNDCDGSKDCVAMANDGNYSDEDCNQKMNFVCKKSTVDLTQNPTCETYDIDYFYSPITKICYKFHVVPVSWHEAFRICRAEESDLATINSQVEAKLFIDNLERYPAHFLKGNFDKNILHVGFNDLLTPGIYLTNDGKPLNKAGYDNWAPNQPDNYNNNERCGSMFRDGSLNDVNCMTRAMFMMNIARDD
ncbi:C-type mannose receptor 2-like isoform X2 [Arctopsyche grandis]|uniref:C-type mannose receptor 2-like isoform X2 n=1 Tax=Arctopsyche grandis TaxID=121162 RepID=UPI00406D6389